MLLKLCVVTLNELIKELKVNEVLSSLITAYRSRDINYLSSAIELIHEEFTYTVSESEELTGDLLRRVSILHALYCIGLGLIKVLKSESPGVEPLKVLDEAFMYNDMTSLTQSLISAVMLALSGNYSWLNDMTNVLRERKGSQPLVEGIVSSFLDMMNAFRSMISS